MYKRRILDDLIARRSKTAGAILVEGIKWCGKTTTCEQSAKSVIYLDEPEKREHNLLMAKIRPAEILDGAIPRLIDEWQLAPALWDAPILAQMMASSSAPSDVSSLKSTVSLQSVC